MKFCKDPQLSLVLNYETLPFSQSHSVSGFTIRVIEIYRLFELKAQIETLGSMVPEMGYVSPSDEELNLLINIGVSHINQLEGELMTMDAQIKSIQHEIESALSDAKKYGGASKAKLAIEDLEHKKALRNESKSAKSESIGDFLRLIALLRKVVEDAEEEIKSNIDFNQLNQITRAPLLSRRYNMSLPSNYTPDATEYAWRMMDDYENSLKGILKKVSQSKDKFEISRGANQKAVFYKDYFSQPTDGHIKMNMTSDEYAEQMFSIHKTRSDKRNKMYS